MEDMKAMRLFEGKIVRKICGAVKGKECWRMRRHREI
jgi:hypothetical protein